MISVLGQSIRSTLNQKFGSRIEYYTEYLDRSLIDDAVYERELVHLWRKKYEGRKIDLIIVCIAPALDLLSKNGAELFPGAPTVFCVLLESELSRTGLGPNVTGIWSATPFRPTLDLALKLHPDTHRVIVVYGSSDVEKGMLEITKSELRDFESAVELVYITDVDVGELRERLARLPKHTIALYGALTNEGAGFVLTGPESLSRIAHTSAAPIYGFSSAHFGSGIVGGSLINFELLGENAAETGARILAGERPQDIAPHGVPNIVMFDSRELGRWGIKESNLPPGSQVLFKEQSFLDQYRWQIAVAAALLIFATLLIAGLVVNRARWVKAEKEKARLTRVAEQEHSRVEEVVSNVPGIVWETKTGPGGATRKSEFVSDYVEKMLGYSVEEWLSTPGFWLSLVPEEDREKVARDTEVIFASGKEGVIQFPWKAKDGRLVWAESHVTPMFDEAGRLVGVRGVTLDITERKLAENALRQSEEKTRDVLRAIPDLMFLQNPEGVYLDYHAGEPSDLLVPPEAFLGKNMADVLPPELAGEFSRLFRRAVATGATQVFEYPLPILGEERWFEARIVGSDSGILTIVRNITDHKRIEVALSENRMQLAGIIDSAMDAIISIDDNQRIVLFNTAAELMFGCDAAEAMGESIARFIPDRFNEAHQEHIGNFGETNVSKRSMGSPGKLYGCRADGRKFPIEASISQVELNGRKFYTAILRDITDRMRAEEAIKESEANYRSIFNAVNDAIFVHDTESGEIVDVNQVMCDMYGVTLDEVRALGLEVLSSNEPPYTREAALEWIRKAVQGEPQMFEWHARDKAGRLFWVEVNLRRSVIGGKDRVLAVVRDITYRRQAEEALRESEERFRTMADTAPVMIWISDTDNLRIYLNQRWLEFTGRTLEAELGGGWSGGIHPEDRERCLETYSRASDRREPFTIEYRLRRADGEFRWIYDSGAPRHSHNGKFLGYIGSCIDITERKGVEDALANLSGQLIRARENECARIARELHDGVNQRMALVSVELEQLTQNPPDTPDKLRNQLKGVMSLISETSKEIHLMSHDLHPSKLTYLGLVPALKGLSDELSRSHGLKIEFAHEDVPSDLPQDISLCFYRIVQECLNNVIRHSGAQEAKVDLRGTGREIRLRVTDSGIGFDIESPRIRKGLGLVSMGERLRLVGGRISIQSRPSHGTEIEARVPLARIGRENEGLLPDDKTRAAGG